MMMIGEIDAEMGKAVNKNNATYDDKLG